MVAARDLPGPEPDVFTRAGRSLRAARLRPEVVVTDVPAPGRVAPYSLALTGEVVPSPRAGEEEAEAPASGRFVVLHDPQGQEGWQGTFRVVSFVRAELDAETAGDPLLGQVAWSWLTDALAAAPHRAVGGTATRVVSESFGVLADRPPSVEVEVRASWTPADGGDLAPHLQAWAELLCTVAGLPPLPAGVSALPLRTR